MKTILTLMACLLFLTITPVAIADDIPSPILPPMCGPPTDTPCDTTPPDPGPAPGVPPCALEYPYVC